MIVLPFNEKQKKSLEADDNCVTGTIWRVVEQDSKHVVSCSMEQF